LIPDNFSTIFHWHNPPAALWSWGWLNL